MRLWSIHPKYLDAKGLCTLWRESFLAQKVLEGKTKGYRNHPQLIRFKKEKEPIKAINSYIYYVYIEAKKRGYKFDDSKIDRKKISNIKIPVTDKQIKYEFDHLLKKLKERDKAKFSEIFPIKKILPHPIFYSVKGEIESWEKLK